MNAQKPYLNLGCGKIQLPCERPLHHNIVNEAIYSYPLWHNVDRHALPGVDQVFDLFAYPWPLEDNSYDGALLSHIVEHIPHEIKTQQDKFRQIQDGWYAFFSELYRVLTPGAMVHILAPYAWSNGAVTDPSHTRLITEHSFSHSMVPEDNGTFYYETGGIHFEMIAYAFRVTPLFAHIQDDREELTRALQTRLNVVYDIYVQLEAIKDHVKTHD